MVQIVIYLLMVQRFTNLKQKILKLKRIHYAYISHSQTIIWKKTGFDGYTYDFSGDYSAIDVDNIKDIHKYLMKKNRIV